MESHLKNLVISTILRQKAALADIQEGKLTRTDLEILAFAYRSQLVTVYKLRACFSQTNVQQIRKSVNRLVQNNLLELMSKGYKNKPSFYVISLKGERIVDQLVGSIVTYS